MGGGWAWSFKDRCQAVSIKSSFAAPQETTIFGQARLNHDDLNVKDQTKGSMMVISWRLGKEISAEGE